MYPRTFVAVAVLVACGCGSPAATQADGENAPNAPPIAAELSRARVVPAAPAPADPRSPSRVMAYVEGEVLTYREILQAVGPELAQLENPADRAKMEKRALTDLLRERLLYRAAADAGVRASRDEIDARRAKFVKDLARNGGTLEAWLHEHDMTRREFDETSRVSLVVEKYRRAAIGHNSDAGVRVRPVTDTYVAPEDVQKYYDRHLDKFSEPAGARYRMLIVKADLDAPDRKASVDAARELAKSAVARLESGDDWVPVFREFNQAPPDPDQRKADGLDSIERGKAAAWIETFAFGSPKGAVHLQEMGTTFYVLQAEGAHDARVVPYEEVAQPIRRELEQLRIGMAFLEVELAVLDESSVQPESVRTELRNTLRATRLELVAKSEQ